MKKFLLLLLALPMVMALTTSCDSDDDLPQVDISYSFSNASLSDNTLYVVKGDTLVIDSVTVTPEPGTKQAQILSVLYRFDGYIFDNVVIPPFSTCVATTDLETGTYMLGLECPVVQVDKTPATAYIRTKIEVVADQSEIPGNSTATVAGRITPEHDLQQK